MSKERQPHSLLHGQDYKTIMVMVVSGRVTVYLSLIYTNSILKESCYLYINPVSISGTFPQRRCIATK